MEPTNCSPHSTKKNTSVQNFIFVGSTEFLDSYLHRVHLLIYAQSFLTHMFCSIEFSYSHIWQHTVFTHIHIESLDSYIFIYSHIWLHGSFNSYIWLNRASLLVCLAAQSFFTHIFGYIQFSTHIYREILDSYMHRVSSLTCLAAYSFFAPIFCYIEFLDSYMPRVS